MVSPTIKALKTSEASFASFQSNSNVIASLKDNAQKDEKSNSENKAIELLDNVFKDKNFTFEVKEKIKATYQKAINTSTNSTELVNAISKILDSSFFKNLNSENKQYLIINNLPAIFSYPADSQVLRLNSFLMSPSLISKTNQEQIKDALYLVWKSDVGIAVISQPKK